MSEPSTNPSPMPTQSASRPLLSTLTRWWAPEATQQAADPELGYESALPWTLETSRDTSHAPY